MPYIYKMSNAGGMSTVTRYTDMLAGNAAFVPSDYESISTVTVGAGGAASITFSSIPATYQHLQVRSLMTSSATGEFRLAFNADTGANYYRHFLYGNGVGPFAGANANSSFVGFQESISANVFGVNVMDILDYTNTNKNTTVRTLAGMDRNGAGDIALYSGLWSNTAAITSITIYPPSGTISQYSSFALYGIRG
jgi:hypothetical protein